MTVCGLDEVGRGSLAGPLVAAGVILGEGFNIHDSEINDSKKLSQKLRGKLFKEIMATAAKIEIETISARQINNKGIGWANKEIFKKLIKKLEADKFIVDGNLKIRVKGKTKQIQCLIKADSKVPEVMAASIIAKVTRDKIMKDLHEKYPRYGWKSNVGYGTKYHIQAIREIGMIHYHRSVFVTTALSKQEV